MAGPAVIFGGPSPEHDISILTGLAAVQALGRPRALYWAKNADWFEVDAGLEASDFADGVPAGARPLRLVTGTGFVVAGRKGLFGGGRDEVLELSAAVNCCHGGPGEDGSLQGVLDQAGVRYTGPGVAAAALGMDKLAFGAVVAALGLPALPRVLLSAEPAWHPGFDGPYIVKPRFGGSSIGIDVVSDAATSQARLAANRHLRSGAVVEPYRPQSVDLEVSVRCHPSLQLSVVNKPERTARGTEIYTYAQKYVVGHGMAAAPAERPARLDPGVERELRGAATALASAIGVRGAVRLDFLLDGGDLHVNEVNTIPGSLSRHLWQDTGVPFATLLADLLAEADLRPTYAPSTDGADGSVLRSAGPIRAKLG